MTNPIKAVVENSLKVLLVSDLERSKSYYRDVLGCEVTEWWAIRDGLSGLGFKLLQAAGADDVRPNPAAKGAEHAWDVYAYVADWEQLDALYEELTSKGAILSYAPNTQDLGWGKWKEFAIKDPDGYGICFGSAAK